MPPTSARRGAVSPESFRAPTPTANDFPTPAGQMFHVTKRDQGLVSPAQSSFSFPDEEEPHAISTPRDMIEEKEPAKRLDRGTPGEGMVMSAANGTLQQQELRKKKSQFYTEVFSYREPNLSPKERIYKDSIVTAEVKTNIIIKDEYEFLQDLSQHLSQRYQRPTSSIFITLSHSACLLFGGSFDSAYMITISALSSQLLPTTNKRNAALLQTFLADSLGVAPARGVIRFSRIPDEDMAYNGTTVLGQIENLQKSPTNENKSIPVLTPFPQRNLSRRQAQPRPRDLPLRAGTQSVPITRVASPALQSPILPSMPIQKSAMDVKAEKVQKLGKRRSFMAIFGR
ncbi:hypothetical protein ACLMJK_002496 [Lecanora helva]